MNVHIEVSDKRISDLLCSALEGGSNYWYRIDEFIEPRSVNFRSDPEQVFRHLDYPLSYGGALVISSMEDDEINGQSKWKLDLNSIYKGLLIMAEKHSRHFGDFMQENDDATTGDVFLQCCLFGDVIYG